eukprot:7208534-Prorocentrum_lima.AAC.1
MSWRRVAANSLLRRHPCVRLLEVPWGLSYKKESCRPRPRWPLGTSHAASGCRRHMATCGRR